jgi:UDP-N-acetylmuramyl pentapeptide phosphotransferase/UDP-N-acetylglucosamine-1-phosphate transferase
MGDVGSLALGYYFGVMALVGVVEHDLSIGAFIILYGFFLVDASVTLVRRMVTGKRWWEAHTEHYYQRAIRAGFTHAQVAAGAMMLTALAAVFASMEALAMTSNGIPFLLLGVLMLLTGRVVSRPGIRGDQTRGRSG